MKLTKRMMSVMLAVLMIVSGACVAGMQASAADGKSAAGAGTLPAKYYSTNGGGKVGVKKTIKIDGDASDWSEDMKIAQSAAWDVANHWKGGHENCVLDLTGLFAAWDDNNLYIGWQMVNTTDTWADREGDGPLSDGGRVLDVPLVVALSIKNAPPTMTGKVDNGKNIWDATGGFSFSGVNVDHLFYMSGKPGLGKPAMFTVADSNGNTDYGSHCVDFKTAGIEYKMAETNICKEIWGLNGSDSPEDVYSESADWVDFKTHKGKRAHKTSYDSFYEMSIPLSKLGITASQLTSTGIGAMVVATRGESAIDCIPFDAASMLDNAKKSYSKDASTSMEKEDADVISVPLASVGKVRSGQVITPDPVDETTPSGEETTAASEETTAAPEETTTQAPTVTETEAPKVLGLYGDVNGDNKVSIKDASAIQKHLAMLDIIPAEREAFADVTGDNKISIKDASAIQKYLAALEHNSKTGENLMG